MIQTDNVGLMTGKFGRDNEHGIKRTAVAAGATINHRLCNKFRLHGVMDYQLIMPGGFLVFASHNRLYEKPTTSGTSEIEGLGDDIFFELLPYTDQDVENEQWGVVRGNDNIPSLWDVK